MYIIRFSRKVEKTGSWLFTKNIKKKVGLCLFLVPLCSWHADEFVAILSSEVGFVAFGRFVREHSEAGCEVGADGAGHSHPVSSSELAVAQVEGLRGFADLNHFFGLPPSRV